MSKKKDKILKQQVKEYCSIWNHGREKGKITVCVNSLTEINKRLNSDEIRSAIKVLELERKRLHGINPIEQ